MKRFSIIFFLSLSLVSVFSQDKKSLSDAKISFVFVSKDVEGTLSGFSSSSSIDLNNISNSRFEGSVKAETIESGNFLRNWSLRGGKYFDVDQYPLLHFKSTAITENQSGFTVNGELTIKGTNKSISIDFKENGNRFDGTTTIYSSDFGIEIVKKSREANEVIVTISFKVD